MFYVSYHVLFGTPPTTRYNLPVVVIIMNNGGIYGGDRRPDALRQAATRGLQQAGLPTDPIPTEFVPTRYDALMEAVGGTGYRVNCAAALAAACSKAFAARQPAVIDVVLDPMAGVESGNVHAFNAPKSKM